MKTPNRSSDEGVFGVLVVIIKVVVINEEKTSFRNRQIKHRIELCPVNVRKYKQKRSVRL